MRYGIPAYRLPPDLLDQEIEQIPAPGIPIHTGAAIGSLETFKKDYDAVFLGLGTQRARLIPIDGVHQPFVLGRDSISGATTEVDKRSRRRGRGSSLWVARDVSIDVARRSAARVRRAST